MSDRILLNPQGLTSGRVRWGEQVAGVLSKSLRHSAMDLPSHLGDKVVPTQMQSPVRIFEVDDRVVVVAENVLGDVDLSVQAEGDGDVVFNLYPSRRRLRFSSFVKGEAPHRAQDDPEASWLKAAERPFKRVLQGVRDLNAPIAEYYDSRKHHRVRLIHDRNRTGMDLLEVRLPNFQKVPRHETLIDDLVKMIRDELGSWEGGGSPADVTDFTF